MKIKFFLFVGLLVLTFSGCSQDSNVVQLSTEDNGTFLKELRSFKEQTKPIIDSLADKSFNYNTSSTRAMLLDNDTLDVLVKHLAQETSTLLEASDIDTDSLYNEGGTERLAYIGLILLDYEKSFSNVQTRASIGECVLRGAGLGDLTVRTLERKAVLRIVIKAGLKRVVPYVGWGLFLGETAACLAGY